MEKNCANHGMKINCISNQIEFIIMTVAKNTRQKIWNYMKIIVNAIISIILHVNTVPVSSAYLFPNPAVNQITITSFGPEINFAVIYNSIGEKIAEYIVNEQYIFTLNINLLKTGIYFLKLKNQNNEFSTRFIKISE